MKANEGEKKRKTNSQMKEVKRWNRTNWQFHFYWLSNGIYFGYFFIYPQNSSRSINSSSTQTAEEKNFIMKMDALAQVHEHTHTHIHSHANTHRHTREHVWNKMVNAHKARLHIKIRYFFFSDLLASKWTESKNLCVRERKRASKSTSKKWPTRLIYDIFGMWIFIFL